LTARQAAIVDKPLRMMAALLQNAAYPVHEAGSVWRLLLSGRIKTGSKLSIMAMYA
jgi:hypothetical protein